MSAKRPVQCTPEEIEYATGERGLCYRYINPPPQVQVTPSTTRVAIGVDENGGEIFEYTVDNAKLLASTFQEWQDLLQAKRDTALK